MYQAQGDVQAGLREDNSGEDFEEALMTAPRATPTKWVFKFDIEGERYDYSDHDSEKFNGLPYADILNFDNKIRSKCGEDFYMKPVIESKRVQKIKGTVIIVFSLILSLALIILYNSKYMIYGIGCGILGF